MGRVILAGALVWAGCGDGSETGVPLDGGADDAMVDGLAVASFEKRTVVDDVRARDARLAISATGVAAIGFSSPGDGTVPCLETVPSGESAATTVRLAVEQAADWVVEEVATVGPGDGLDVLWEDDDVLVVYQGGASGQRVCAPSDLMLARRSAGYSPDVLVATSGEAPSTEPYSGEGDVVGSFPAAALDGTDLIVAYGDTHFGYTRDDFERSDLEIVRDGSPQVVEAARGAGYLNAIAIGSEGQVAVAFVNRSGNAIEDRAGIRLAMHDESSWSSERILAADPETSLAVAFDGSDPVVAAFDPEDEDLIVARPGESGFVLDRVDRRRVTGQHADITSDGGRLAISFYHCGRGPRTDCDPAEDALRVATLAGDSWRVEDVDRGGDDERCGMHTSIAVRPGGRVAIAYVCHDTGGPGGRLLLAEEP